MSQEPLDRSLASWLHEQTATPAYLDEVLERTRQKRQRPAWSIPERWIPMQLTMRPAIVPRQLVYVALLALLIAAAAIAVVTIGAPRPAPPPFGLAGNGLVAFDRNGTIALARPDGTTLTDIVTTIEDARGPVFSPDGGRLAFYGTVDGSPTVIVSAADGRDPIPVSRRVVLDDVAMETAPSWSPDSRHLVFGGLVGEQRQLFIAPIDGSGARAVGDSELSRMDPMWSPDGDWIAFHGFRPDADAEAGQYRTSAGLYLIRPNGLEETMLVEGVGGDFIYRRPQWLPDPARAVLAYSVGEPSLYDIALFDVSSGKETVVSDHEAAELWPVWSPDASSLAWAGSDRLIRFARADGTNIWTVPDDVEYQFVWSPNGQYLLGLDASGALIAARTDGSRERVEFSDGGASGSHWSWQRVAP